MSKIINSREKVTAEFFAKTTLQTDCEKLSAIDIAKLGLLAAIWGASFIFMRLAVPETGILLTASLRIILASVILLAFTRIRKTPMDWQGNIKPYALAGLFGAALPFVLFSYSAQYLPAAISALFNATCPLFSSLFSIVSLSEQLTLRKFTGLLLGITGVILLVGTSSAPYHHSIMLALLACIAAPACFAVSAIIIKLNTCATTTRRIEPLAMATGSMVMAGLMLLPIIPISLPQHIPSAFAMSLVLALALLPSAIAQIIFIPLIARIGATRAMSVSFLIPLFSMLWGFLFLQESIQISCIAGGLVVLIATGLILKAKYLYPAMRFKDIYIQNHPISLLQDGFPDKQHIKGNTTMKKTSHTIMQCLTLSLCTLGFLLCNPAVALTDSSASIKKQLETAVNGSWRAPENRMRDQYRHPLQTLEFFGVKPNAKVIELLPGGKAYYTEILAPFLHGRGELTIVNINGNPEDAGQKEKFTADPAHYDKIKTIILTQPTPDKPPALNFGAENSADYLLTFRNVHNFAMKDMQGLFFNEAFRVLKSGGTLGVVDHRADANKTYAEVKGSGYQPEAFVIAEAEKAGFKLMASSNINSNPKDTKDYPKGVWSLPPTFEEHELNREKYIAIGESDRFTLRFIKP